MRLGGQRDLTRGSIPRHVVALAVPAVLSTLVHQLYGLNDIFFSKYVGLAAQTAVSNNLFTLITLFGFIQLASVGILTLVSRRSGAGNIEGAEQAARQGLIFAVAISVVTAVIGLLLTPVIPRLMGMEDAVRLESNRYLGVIFLGLPFMFLAPALDSIFRGRGDTVTPLLLHIAAVTTNIAGNAMSVFVLDAGTVGIAASTILSRFVWVAIAFMVIRRGRLGISLERKPGPFANTTIWRAIARVSAPLAARTFLFGFVYLVVSSIASRFGSAVQNGMGVGIRVEGLCFFVLVGFGMAAGPLVGQNLGATQPARAARAAWTTLGIALVPACLFSAVFLLFPVTLMNIFASDAATAGHGAAYLRIVAICLVFVASEVVLANSFIGAGDTLPPMLVDVPLTAIRIPLAYWLTGPVGMGPEGIWWAITGTAIGRGVLMALWFYRGRWKRARPDLD